MTIKEFKQWWNRFEYSGNFPEPKAEHINLLLAEVDRLRADRQLEADIDLPAGVLALKRENGELKAECQKWQEWHDCEYRERKKYRQDANHFAGEVQRLTAELAEAKAYKDVIDEALIVSCIGVASGDARADLHKLLVWEIDVALDPQVSKRAAGLLAEKDAEIEKVTHERDLWENIAAMRLADQEAIERHVTKRVAGEIVDIMNHCETFQDVKAVIRQKYGVE